MEILREHVPERYIYFRSELPIEITFGQNCILFGHTDPQGLEKGVARVLFGFMFGEGVPGVMRAIQGFYKGFQGFRACAKGGFLAGLS